MELCQQCGYPVSEILKVLIAAKIRPRGAGVINSICSGCGITDEEMCTLGEGDPSGLIALLKEKRVDDWWWMAYKFGN